MGDKPVPLVTSDMREPGIRRRRSGRGFRYLLPDGTQISDAATKERIRAVAIPPAWTDGRLVLPGSCGSCPGDGDRRGLLLTVPLPCELA